MKFFIFYIFILFSFSVSYARDVSTLEIDKIQIFNINSSINPATLNYLSTNIKEKTKSKNTLLLIKLNTPGGLVSTTKEILTLFGGLENPIVIWVTPDGASATSAGAIIASSAHVLVMSSSTNIGAATPIEMSGDIKDGDAKSKAVNDLVALIKSFANARGRSEDGFTKMITQAKSFTSEEALKENIIDGIINSELELTNFLQDRVITIKGNSYKLLVSTSYEKEEIKMDLGQEILNIFSNPSLAYILFILGAALIYFEFQAPGGFIAGGLGVLSLLMAGVGFQVLPISIGSILLIVLAFILFILEAYVASHGILSVGGLISLIFGSLFLYRSDNSYIEISFPIIISTIFAVVVYLIAVAFIISKTRHKREKYLEEIDFKKGIVLKKLKGLKPFKYQIKIQGEIWQAFSNDEFEAGEECEVHKTDNSKLTLEIKKP